MSTITQARQAIIDAVETALPGVPVYGVPPGNVAAPCVFIGLGRATDQPTLVRWDADMVVTLVGPAGDNEAAVEWLETAILDAAAMLSTQTSSKILWDAPGQATIAGTTYLVAKLTVPIDLEL